MTRVLTGQRLLITGASSGIGGCLAKEAGMQGARLALTARSGNRLEVLAREIVEAGGEAIAVAGDVTRAADRQRLLAKVAQGYGGLDEAINTVGVGSLG